MNLLPRGSVPTTPCLSRSGMKWFTIVYDKGMDGRDDHYCNRCFALSHS